MTDCSGIDLEAYDHVLNRAPLYRDRRSARPCRRNDVASFARTLDYLQAAGHAAWRGPKPDCSWSQPPARAPCTAVARRELNIAHPTGGLREH